MSRLPCRPDIRVGDVAQQRLAELAHRLGGQPELAVGGALEVAGVAQRLLQLGERAGVDGRLVAELAGELVEVDVVHPGAVVGLRELLGRGRRGRPGPAGRRCRRRGRGPARRRTARSRPSPRPAAAPAGCRRARTATASARASRTPAADRASARRAARASSSSSSAGPRPTRWASASSSSSMFCGFSGKKSPCLSMNSENSWSVSSPSRCASSSSLRSASISLTRCAVLVGGVLQRLLHALRSAGRAAPGRAGP